MANLFRIGDVSKVCEIPIKTLRFYEEEGIIKPVKVDIYTGYRYYDDNNIIAIYKVKLLKNLGFSLKEIREFNESSLKEKIEEIEKQLNQLKDKKAMILYLQKQKGEKIMKPFINDEKAIGKWVLIATAKSKTEYEKGNFKQEKSFIKNLYFMPNGKGYWIFDRWTKGELYHFSGIIWNYQIEKDKLFLDLTYENKSKTTLIFSKVDSNEYTIEEIKIKDDLNFSFEEDKNAVGFWEAIDFINFKNKDNYRPEKCSETLFVKSLTINPNGEYIIENTNGMLLKNNWTKGKIFNKIDCTSSDYIIKEIEGEKYLILDWKSGDYSWQGDIIGCYVFKKF